MQPVEVVRGSGPIVLGFPHAGTYVPEEIFGRLNDLGQALSDTDWYVDRLYNDLLDGITIVRATFHRYVIDANRDPTDQSLYPGQNTTGLVPITNFDGQPIWRVEPSREEIQQRCRDYHAPYHAALESELLRVRAIHGCVLLYDCHSIRSEIPFLFDGRLPDFNIGTYGGKTCAGTVAHAVEQICRASHGYSTVVNGRFQGGWTTRHYGNPDENIHSLQMELAQKTYLEQETGPFTYSDVKAEELRKILKAILGALRDLAPKLGPLLGNETQRRRGRPS